MLEYARPMKVSLATSFASHRICLIGILERRLKEKSSETQSLPMSSGRKCTPRLWDLLLLLMYIRDLNKSRSVVCGKEEGCECTIKGKFQSCWWSFRNRDWTRNDGVSLPMHFFKVFERGAFNLILMSPGRSSILRGSNSLTQLFVSWNVRSAVLTAPWGPLMTFFWIFNGT